MCIHKAAYFLRKKTFQNSQGFISSVGIVWHQGGKHVGF